MTMVRRRVAIGSKLRRWLALLVSAATCSVLAACLDYEQDITFSTDGSALLTARFAVDQEMEDVYIALEALARLSPDANLAPLRSGFCSTAQLDAARPPGASAIVAQARRYVVANQSICEISVLAPQLEQPSADLGALGIFTMQRTGPRQWDIAFDFTRIPDITPLLMIGLLNELQKRPEFQGGVSSAEMLDVTEKLKRGVTALTAVSMRNRYVQVAFVAPRIIASEGAASSDATAVRFRLTFAELSDLLLKPETRRGKRYRVVVAY